MKVKIIKTGEIVDVNTARANYWIRIGVAREVEAEKVNDTPIEKKAVVRKPINKKATKKRNPTKKK